MNSARNSSGSSHISPQAQRSSEQENFFAWIKRIVDQALLPRDLEELGPESGSRRDDRTCCRPPRGYAPLSVVDELHEHSEKLNNKVLELERELGRQQRQHMVDEDSIKLACREALMQKEDEHAARVRAEDELAEVRGDLVASARALQAEREYSNALSQKVELSDKHVETVRAEIDTVNAELGALKERLSSKDNELGQLRQELGSIRQAYAAPAVRHWSPRLHRQPDYCYRAWANVASPTQPMASPTLDMTRTYSLSSMDSIGEVGSGLGAIVEEAEAETRDPSASQDAASVGKSELAVPSPSGSDAAEGRKQLYAGDREGGGSRCAVAAERSESPPCLKLDLVHFVKDTEWDDADEDEDSDAFAGKFSSADYETPIVGTRNSFFGSNGARRACKVSLSLSPTHLSGTKALASVDHAASRNQSQAAVPTTIEPLYHGLDKGENVVILELGAWKVRGGVVTTAGTKGRGMKSFFDDFPCCLARPTREDADLDELVNGASSLAAPMYAKFRETGVFVGGDAWYCCLDHPSIALRSKLRLSCPMQRGKKLGREDVDMFMGHAFGLLNQDSSCTPTLLTYKSTATAEEVLEMVAVLLEAHRVPSIRMVNEAELAALAVGSTTGVLVDIGESGFSVTPIFDGCPIAPGARWEACGGADITEYMDTMLHSRNNEKFNQMTDKRRLEMSRELKEELCYVPLDFNVEAEEHGSFRQKVMRICKGARLSPKLAQYESCETDKFLDETDEDAGVKTAKTFTLKSGDELLVTLGRERFHAPEILFTPRMWNNSGASKGLPEVVMDALSSMDTDTMAEMLGDVVVVGGSAAFEGLRDRLEEELKGMLPEALANRVEVRVPSADHLRHRNPLSRCSPSAVMIGAELLLEREGLGGEPWITCTSWAEQPEVLTAALAPYVRDDSPRGKSVK